MIVTSCPLRISLAGGSTDLEDFLKKNGSGSVISFSSNLRTYISLHADVLGINRLKNNYVINYSQREEETHLKDIKNDIARVVLEYFQCGPVCCSFTSDVFSSGSGLASSSSYLISFIKAVALYQGKKLSDFEVCDLALKLERQFNPLTGQQDTYGCGLGSLKRLTFYPDRPPTTNYLPQSLFEEINMFLLFSDIRRNSTTVLNEVSRKGIVDRLPLLDIVDQTEEAIITANRELFYKCVSQGWDIKKQTSPMVIENEELQKLDKILDNSEQVRAHRLCGAGNGGFFLLFTDKGKKPEKDILSLNKSLIEVTISEDGLRGTTL